MSSRPALALASLVLLLGLARVAVAQDREPVSDDEEEQESTEPAANPFARLPRGNVESSLSRALEQPEAAFCKSLRVGSRDDALCSLSKLKAQQRCPALARACQALPSSSEKPLERSASSTLSGLGNVLFWAVIAALIVGALLALRQLLGSAQLPVRRARPRPAAEPLPQAVPRVRSARDSDVARLWALAQEQARAARFADALAALQGALIHALRLSGKLHVTPALTHGDYLRSLRSDAELHGAAREVFRAVEAVEFGGAPATDDTFRRLFARVQPIVQRALALACLLLFVFQASACSSFAGLSGADAAHGRGVLTRLLSDQHTTVRRRIRSLAEIEPDVTAILIEGEQKPEVWPRLFEFVADGGTLIVLSDDPEVESSTGLHFAARRYDGKVEPDAWLGTPDLELTTVSQFALDLPTGNADRERATRTLAWAGKRPYVVRQYYGAGDVLFFADASFLGNASLSVGDNAYFAVALLQRPGETLEMVGPWTGGGEDSTLSALSKAGLGTVIAQLAVVGLLFAWFGGVAFGARRDPAAAHRRAFSDHVLALAENYRRARATRFVLATYGAWLIERLRDRLSPQQPIGLIDLAGRLATRVDASEVEVVQLLTEAREAQDDLDGAKPSDPDLWTLNRIEMWMAHLGGSK